MKYIIAILGIILLSSYASALGLFYGQTSANVVPGQDVCFSYGIYNTDSSPATASVDVRGDIKQFLVSSEPSVNVPANTAPDSSARINVCFKVPASACAADQRYSGNVIIMQAAQESSGSAASVGAAAPLELVCGGMVSSVPETSSNGGGKVIFPIVVAILVLAILFLFYKKMSRASFEQGEMTKNKNAF